jgi:hypothetical protein
MRQGLNRTLKKKNLEEERKKEKKGRKIAYGRRTKERAMGEKNMA